MWYEILVKNQVADYFINGEPANEETAAQMRKEYADIVYGVTTAWTLCKDQKDDTVQEQIARLGESAYTAFDFCRSHMPFSAANSLSQILQSIRTQFHERFYDIDLSLLNEEQCAVLIMYPFWSRMGGSFEEEFLTRGDFKKYLCALKSKLEQK